MRVAVTGATGYIGQKLAIKLIDDGHELVALSRSQPAQFKSDWRYYDLASASNDLPLVDVIVHLAANTSGEGLSQSQEVDAAACLLAHANAVSAQVLFISSQTASDNASTAYGKIKWDIERLVLAGGGNIIRPGQVYGGELLGLYGAIVGLVRTLPLLPHFVPGPTVQPVHVDDLVEAIGRLAEDPAQSSKIYYIGASSPVSFAEFLAAIAKYRLRSFKLFVPVPSILISMAASILGSQSAAARLHSLFTLQDMSTTDDLKALGITLRPLESGLQPSGRGRRALLKEGFALFSYVLNRAPTVFMLRPYVRAIELLGKGRLLGLPEVTLCYPSLLGLYDGANIQRSHWNREVMWRIDAATSLAEASPMGAVQYLGIGQRSNFINSFVLMGWSVLVEAGWRIARFVFSPWLSFKAWRWRKSCS